MSILSSVHFPLFIKRIRVDDNEKIWVSVTRPSNLTYGVFDQTIKVVHPSPSTYSFVLGSDVHYRLYIFVGWTGCHLLIQYRVGERTYHTVILLRTFTTYYCTPESKLD